MTVSLPALIGIPLTTVVGSIAGYCLVKGYLAYFGKYRGNGTTLILLGYFLLFLAVFIIPLGIFIALKK